MVRTAPLVVTRAQILAYRRRVGALEERMTWNATSLRRAAWAGLQDSMPRAALLSIHARTLGTKPNALEHPSLVQLWGPRYSTYVVAARDRAVFTLGRLPEDGAPRRRAEDIATRLHAFLAGRRLGDSQAGHAMGIHPSALRYAAPTGTILIRWDGARQPTVRSVPAPDVDPARARLELARRYLHVFGPATAASFATWAGIPAARAHATFDALATGMTRVRMPIGEAWILAADEAWLRARPVPATATRLLPSGDAYFLLQGADRELLVPERERRAMLWTTRVWPGAVLVRGEVVGIWRRAGPVVSIQAWRRISRAEREGIEAEASTLPLPDVAAGISVRWEA